MIRKLISGAGGVGALLLAAPAAFAQAAAALAVSRAGVQDAMPRRDEVEQLLVQDN